MSTNIDPTLKSQVRQRLLYHVAQTNKALGLSLRTPHLQYDIRGATAGMAVAKTWTIRLNPSMLSTQPEAFIKEVPGHEWAHLVVYQLHGQARHIRPHGKEWQAIMQDILGLAPRTTHRMRYTKARQERQITYRCQCPESSQYHQLGIRRHNKIRRGQAQYQCRRCGSTLQQVDMTI